MISTARALALGGVLLSGFSATGCPTHIAARMHLGTQLSLEAVDAEGGLRELGGQGPPRLVVIWASWCAQCPKALEEAAKLAQIHGLLFAAVSVDADQKLARAAMMRLAIPGPQLWDEAARAASLAGVRRTPTILMIGGDGKLAGIFEGVELGTLTTLRRAVAGMRQAPP